MYTGLVQGDLHADITVKDFYKISVYKIVEFSKYIDMNIKHSC